MKITVFAAHPDDAETTVGGSICRYTAAGHAVHVVNMTNNGTARVKCAADSAAVMGNTVEFMDFKDSEMTVTPEGIELVRKKILERKPDLIWTQFPADVHIDHICTGALVLEAVDAIRLEDGGYAPELWFFAPCEGYQALCFHPDHFEDVSDFYERKRKAVACYDPPIPIWDCYPIHLTIDKFHGYQAGCEFAEGFAKCNFRIGPCRHRVIGDYEYTEKK